MQQDIVETSEEAQQKYEEENKDGNRSKSSLRATIIAAMDAKRQKLNAPFTKHLTIANPANGSTCLIEVKILSLLMFVPLVYLAQNALLY